MARPARALAMALAIAAAGCSSAPLSPDTAPTVFGGGIPVAALASASPGPYDGLYTGAATVEVNMNLACSRQVPLGGFRVDGGEVRFGGFRGPVRPDGSVLLQYGHSSMAGRFADGAFLGRVILYPSLLNEEESCVYRASLNRVAT